MRWVPVLWDPVPVFLAFPSCVVLSPQRLSSAKACGLLELGSRSLGLSQSQSQ